MNRKNLIAAAVVASVTTLTASCAWWAAHGKPVITDGWDCIKEEAKAATAGQNWLSLGLEVADAFIGAISAGVNPTAEVVILVKDFGAPIVACTINELRGGTPAGSGSSAPMDAGVPADAGSGSGMMVRRAPAPVDPVVSGAQQAIDDFGWSYK